MDKRTEILDAAERRARLSGYCGFSFRQVAEDVGIKSASVHYHFPTKEKLGEALTDRYIQKAMEALGDARSVTPEEAFDRISGLFLNSHESDDLMCLCGVFGAESAALPDCVRIPVGRFFDHVIDWLTIALPGEDCRAQAQLIVACLEGALIITRAGDDPERLRTMVDDLRRERLG